MSKQLNMIEGFPLHANWSLKVFNIDRSIINKGEPVLYYLKDGPKRGFVREELMIVPNGTELPPVSK